MNLYSFIVVLILLIFSLFLLVSVMSLVQEIVVMRLTYNQAQFSVNDN